MNMEFLYFLETIRNPFLDAVMLFITSFGEEMIFMLIAIFTLWCVDKYEGYYLLFIGFVGTQINQLLKVLFRVPRPWVKDPKFTVVEGAVAEATGYSFPSGHTQSSVGTFGGLARFNKNKLLRIICIALCMLVPFSRMYLGVHTPADVLTSVVIALALVFVLYPLVRNFSKNPKNMRIMLLVMSVWSIAQVLFMEFYDFPLSADAEQLFSGLKNAYKMLGAVLGMWVVYELDIRYINFETKAVWWAQLLKLLIGISITLGIKEICYFIFAFIPNEAASRVFSYFFMVLFAGAVWPLTFKFFGKLGKTKQKD
ncbi:MAG: phosphatase PAP2 family protein [Ruminococcaceae bacterium]|nr:phosphatase PAP2 family protein [Oscillospiraceae bacterium]